MNRTASSATVRALFIRSTASGERYFTFRLVRSERVGSKVRQRTLLNLGRHFQIAQPDWPALCRRIDEILTGQLALEHDAPGGWRRMRSASSPNCSHAPAPPAQDPTSNAWMSLRSNSSVRARSAWSRWGCGDGPARASRPAPGASRARVAGAAAIGSVIARMARPGSDRATRRWLGE